MIAAKFHKFDNTHAGLIFCSCGESFSRVKQLSTHIKETRGIFEDDYAPQHDISDTPAPQHRDQKSF